MNTKDLHLGVDISSWQVFVNYKKLLDANVEFVYIKKNNGRWPNLMYKIHRARIEALGIPTGAYLFLLPGNIEKQVVAFLKGLEGHALIPVVDIEDRRLTVSDVESFFIHWKRLTGDRPLMIYTRANIWGRIGVKVNEAFEFFIALYPRSKDGEGPLTKLSAGDNILGRVADWKSKTVLIPDTLPKPWLVWQFDDKGIGPSFGTSPVASKSIDLDVLRGDMERIMDGEYVKEEEPKEKPIGTFTPYRNMNLRSGRISSKPEVNIGRAIGVSTTKTYDIFDLRPGYLARTLYQWARISKTEWMAVSRHGRKYGDLGMHQTYVVLVSIYHSDKTMVEVQAMDEEDAKEIARSIVIDEWDVDPRTVFAEEIKGPYQS